MSAQSSVLAPGSQGRSTHNRVGRQNTAWLALAGVAMLVALGAAAMNPGRQATTVAPPAGLTAVPHQALSPAADDTAVQVSGTSVGGTAARGFESAGIPHQALGEAAVSSSTAARGIEPASIPHQALGDQ